MEVLILFLIILMVMSLVPCYENFWAGHRRIAWLCLFHAWIFGLSALACAAFAGYLR